MPKEIPSGDYHDYVFKDGSLVGDFEGMYRHSTEVPWHQDLNSFDVISDIDIAILRRGSYDRICDLGCGLGYFTSRLKNELPGRKDAKPAEVVGLDISPKAVEEAARLHPDCSFKVADILTDEFSKLEGNFDLVVCRGVLWYVVQQLDEVLLRLAGLGKDRAHILVTLSFPPSETWVGMDVIGSADDLKSHLSKIMDLSHWCVEYDVQHGNVPLCHAYGALKRNTTPQ